jgi:hypothetical protein
LIFTTGQSSSLIDLHARRTSEVFASLVAHSGGDSLLGLRPITHPEPETKESEILFGGGLSAQTQADLAKLL